MEVWSSIGWLLLWISFCPSWWHWVLVLRSCLWDYLKSNFAAYRVFDRRKWRREWHISDILWTWNTKLQNCISAKSKTFQCTCFHCDTPGILVPESEKVTLDKTMLHRSPGTRQTSPELETSTPRARFSPHIKTPRKQGAFKIPPERNYFDECWWCQEGAATGIRPSKMVVPTECTKRCFERSMILEKRE